MSRRFSMLAQPDLCLLERQALLQRLLAHGVTATLRTPPPAACLRFRLSRADGALVCRVEAATWAATHLPDLAGLDWQGMDASTVFGLTAQPIPLRFDHPGLGYTDAEPLPPAEAHEGAALPMIHSEEGPVWIEQMEWTLADTRGAVALPADFRVQLRLRLGDLRITERRRRRLRCGDILLLRNPAPQAWRGNRPIFDFHLHPESISVNTIPAFVDIEDSNPEQVESGPAPMHDLADLPLNLDVSLGQLHLSLGELSTLQAGTILPLPEQAYQRIQLLHGSQVVATGELVQIGDRLGVQMTRITGLS